MQEKSDSRSYKTFALYPSRLQAKFRIFRILGGFSYRPTQHIRQAFDLGIGRFSDDIV
jgi:hypothetical protein